MARRSRSPPPSRQTRRAILERVQQPGFVIKGRHGDIRLPTIEQWRARFVAEMGKLTPDAAVPLLLAKARTSASSLL
jgi:hypothetical protein